MRKVLRGALLVITVPFTPYIVVALYAAAYVSRFLLKCPWIAEFMIRRPKARLDEQRGAIRPGVVQHGEPILIDHADDSARVLVAQPLLDRVAVDGQVELLPLSVLHLFALGAVSRVGFDAEAARIWFSRSQEERDDETQSVLSGFAARGMLHQSGDSSQEPTGQHYRLSPPLGLIVAARARPSFIVACEVEKHPHLREPVCYGVSGQANSVQTVVIEWPVRPPEGHEIGLSRLGPFGRLNRYVLATVDCAAEILAEWAMLPTTKPRIGKQPVRAISMSRHDAGGDAMRARIAVRSDGTHARLVACSETGADVPAECDRQDLAYAIRVMLSLR